VDTLKVENPYTVFAPTDAALAKLPDGTVELLLKPENKDKLLEIPTYRVVTVTANAPPDLCERLRGIASSWRLRTTLTHRPREWRQRSGERSEMRVVNDIMPPMSLAFRAR